MKYIRDLHKADDRVQSVSPQIHKSNRPFVGIFEDI
jgi:protein AbiQ